MADAKIIYSEQVVAFIRAQQDELDCAKKEIERLKATPASNAALADEIEWPVYHSQGMGCGIEDRGITSATDTEGRKDGE